MIIDQGFCFFSQAGDQGGYHDRQNEKRFETPTVLMVQDWIILGFGIVQNRGLNITC